MERFSSVYFPLSVFPIYAFARSFTRLLLRGLFLSAVCEADLSEDESYSARRVESSEVGVPLYGVAQAPCPHSSPGPRVRQGTGPIGALYGRSKMEQPARDSAWAPPCPEVGLSDARCLVWPCLGAGVGRVLGEWSGLADRVSRGRGNGGQGFVWVLLTRVISIS